MKIGPNLGEAFLGLTMAIGLLTATANAQEKKEFSYTVGPGAVISITNNYGPITVKPSGKPAGCG